MLRWRLILGAILIAAVALLCWLDFHAARPGTYLLPLALLAAGLGAGELVSIWRNQPHPPRAEVVYGGSLLIVAATGLPIVWPAAAAAKTLTPMSLAMLALATTVVWAFVAEMRRYERPGGVTTGTALAIFAAAYVGLLLSFAVQLRLLGGSKLGLMALVSLILVVKMTDIGAYTVGRLIGRHKMTPTLSPGKTWEGFVGGAAFAIVSSYVLFEVVLPRMELTPAKESPAWGWCVFGVAIAIAGTLGDLAESLLKRDAGRKDSSTWMPGFGGVLDLLDSILMAAPVAYACWAVGLVGQ